MIFKSYSILSNIILALTCGVTGASPRRDVLHLGLREIIKSHISHVTVMKFTQKLPIFKHLLINHQLRDL